MVRWGKVEVPELDQIPLRPGTKAPVQGHGLLAFGTTLHRPTGLRLTAYQSDYNDRGMWHEFYLTPPAEEDWRLEVAVTTRFSIRSRYIDHLGPSFGKDLKPDQTHRDLMGQLLLKGEEYECTSATRAYGAPPAQWTVERRDAAVLMLFWAMECEVRSIYGDTPAGPLPSTLIFAPMDVPRHLHGTFRNPVWQPGQ
ncbi:MAG: hypothetical protein MUE52_02750 [Tabrizicola sp.]|jgi:hypothetical protein|nr:hypothetical protein [Tabrizicola sp.]